MYVFKFFGQTHAVLDYGTFSQKSGISSSFLERSLSHLPVRGLEPTLPLKEFLCLE